MPTPGKGEVREEQKEARALPDPSPVNSVSLNDGRDEKQSVKVPITVPDINKQ